MGSIVPKEQNFKNSNERMADVRAVVYSLPQIGQFELFWSGLPWQCEAVGSFVARGSVNIARKT